MRHNSFVKCWSNLLLEFLSFHHVKLTEFNSYSGIATNGNFPKLQPVEAKKPASLGIEIVKLKKPVVVEVEDKDDWFD